MKIEITEEVIKLNVGGKLQVYNKGDVVTVEDPIGELCCQHGWGLDVDGAVPSNERKPGANGKVVPDNVVTKQA